MQIAVPSLKDCPGPKVEDFVSKVTVFVWKFILFGVSRNYLVLGGNYDQSTAAWLAFKKSTKLEPGSKQTDEDEYTST